MLSVLQVMRLEGSFWYKCADTMCKILCYLTDVAK